MATAARMSQAELEGLVLRFTDAFNRDDLDAVMTFMADDATYDEFNGKRSRGKVAIREAFVPQFRGDYGRIRFQTEDLFVDPGAGKALIRWRCSVERNGVKRGWRGWTSCTSAMAASRRSIRTPRRTCSGSSRSPEHL